MTPPDPAPRPTRSPDRSRAGATTAACGVARATVDVAAPPERVFRALVDPADLAAWWGGDADGGGGRTHDWSADARPGGRWRVRTTDAAGREMTVEGEYRVVDPPHTLETTWRAGGEAIPSTVRYDLAPIDVGGAPGTRVTVTHTGPHTGPDAGPQMCAPAQAHAAGRVAVRPAWAARVRAPAWAARPRDAIVA